MTIRTRLVLLLVGLMFIFGLSAAGFRLSHRDEVDEIVASLRQEREGLLDRLLELTGRSLASFASDYSLWDEMVRFVQTGDAAWAGINIDPSLPNFEADAAWVARPDGSLLHHATRGSDAALPPPPFDQPAFLKRLQHEKSLHYFQDTPAGLLEFRTGAILPSDDIKREQEPRGWFIVARHWDESRLVRLGDNLQSHVSLAPADSPLPRRPPTTIHLERRLTTWDGRVVRVLQVEYESLALVRLLAGNREELYLFYGFGAVVILAVVFTLTHQVIRPLQRLSQSLASGTPAPILKLQRNRDEFGHLARQAAQAFHHRDALHESEARLRQWMTLHDRLARDMHDGIIQSVYAAGLGVESARNLIRTDPASAEQRLASGQRMLNDALWQLRTFIQLLEPEHANGQTPAQSLDTLVANMQALQTVPIVSEIDPVAAARIPAQHELHVLHMAREILSNALRHSGASRVRVTLRSQGDGLIRLKITDDGNGFNPESSSGSGRGLANLAARAREIDARLEINSTPGTGTRIALTLRPATAASPL